MEYQSDLVVAYMKGMNILRLEVTDEIIGRILRC